jgi:activator of 2-hydroxyglutaryl-CoA dehydratase
MTEDQQERLRSLEGQVSEMRVRQAHIEGLLAETANAVSGVKKDTEEIVSLVKGASVLVKLSRWIVAIGGAYLAGKGLKWW